MLGFLAPDSLPGPIYTGVVVGIALAMTALTETLQGEALAAHERAGGRVGSGWATAGVGLAFLVLLAAGIFGGQLLAYSMQLGDSVELDELTVYYKDGATRPRRGESASTCEIRG